MSNTRLTWLFERYRNRLTTAEEEEELFQLIDQSEYDEQLKALLTAAWEQFQPGNFTLPPRQSEEMYRHILENTQPSRHIRGGFWGPMMAAAAAVLLLIAIAGGYFIYRYQTTQLVNSGALQAGVQDIAPGSNKALLTLANGTTVILDSTGNQVIQQGSVAIHQHNGQLQYKGSAASTETVYNTLTTPRGGKFKIVLPDGSVAWLNSASSLRYPATFNGKERVVELHGQGYFEIAQNARQPFKVKVNDMEVQVLGTSFDIMAYEEESTVNTTLLEGGVKVLQGNVEKVLKPGQQAILDEHTATIDIQPADVNRIIAWKNGRFIFNNMDLETILREVARWYDVTLEYRVKPGKEKYGGGISRSLSLAAVLKVLEENGNNHFSIEGRKVIILP